MTLASIVRKNLWRRKSRNFLTVAGVATGVGACVALCALAWGLDLSWQESYEARGTDLVMVSGGSGRLFPGDFPHPERGDLEAVRGLEAAAGVLSELVRVGGGHHLLLFGWEPGSYLWDHIDPGGGRKAAGGSGGAWIGAVAAEILSKKPGDTIEIAGRQIPVDVVFESRVMVENTVVIVPLPIMQEILDRPGNINFLNLRLRDGADREAVRRELERGWPGLRTFAAADVSGTDTGTRLAKAMSVATSLVAIVVGCLAMTNALLAGVAERISEIGLLMAVGWRRGRVAGMILLESFYLGFPGALLGVAGGYAVVRSLQAGRAFGGMMRADFNPLFLVSAVLVATVLAGLCGVLPALRAASLRPKEALNRRRL